MKSGIIEEIKGHITCPDYMAREHGSHLVGGRCKSFRPEANNNSSLMVNERDWYDFGSGKGGDIIDLAAIDKFNGDKGAAIRYLAEKWGIQSTVATPHLEIVFRTYLAVLDAATTFYQNALPPHINYLHARGLTDATIRDLRIGWSDNPCEALKSQGFTQEQIAESGILSFVNRYTIPYLRNGRTVYMAARASTDPAYPSSNPDAKYMKLSRTEYSEHPVWGLETLRRPGDVIIAEGIFDAIACYQEGFPVVSAVTGAFSAEQKKDLIPALKGRDVTVCMDYDPETKAGQTFTKKVTRELFDAGIHVCACFLKGDAKKVDLADLYQQNPCKETLVSALADAKPWEKIEIAEIGAIKNENEKRAHLTEFLRKCVKNFDWPTVAQMIADASTLTDEEENPVFAPEWLKELKKTLKAPPSELAIVEEFKKKYDIIFHESLGWYEYAQTYWEQKSEYVIRQYIADLYGSYRTARNVDGVYRLLRAELIRTELFDQTKELLNFPNGMLNIETGEILPHSRDYYSSIQMTYAYDPAAEAPEWRKFLDDITAGDLARHNILQEMFGYCLTKDARYQKCFCLIGNGANGKSVLLNVLEAMVGKANTSHVEVAFLNSDFQRIGLLSSMVNVCNDMKSDVSGTEAFLKSIVAGDPITACYKGKDFVNFHPYCKMVFSSNRMLTAKEVDFSYLRRICFINFPVTFVDHAPDSALEKPRDPTILDRLLLELPGILNWALAGLRELRKNNTFTVTADQRQRERDMLTINNPLISFVEDVIQEAHWIGARSRTDIYREYNNWCHTTNSAPMSSRMFWPRLRLVLPFKETRTSNGRFIEFPPNEPSSPDFLPP